MGRGLSAYVGREREIEILERHLAEARDRLQVVDVVAEPGMGKSRLLHEFRARIGKLQGFTPTAGAPSSFRGSPTVIRHFGAQLVSTTRSRPRRRLTCM